MDRSQQAYKILDVFEENIHQKIMLGVSVKNKHEVVVINEILFNDVFDEKAYQILAKGLISLKSHQLLEKGCSFVTVYHEGMSLANYLQRTDISDKARLNIAYQFLSGISNYSDFPSWIQNILIDLDQVIVYDDRLAFNEMFLFNDRVLKKSSQTSFQLNFEKVLGILKKILVRPDTCESLISNLNSPQPTNFDELHSRFQTLYFRNFFGEALSTRTLEEDAPVEEVSEEVSKEIATEEIVHDEPVQTTIIEPEAPPITDITEEIVTPTPIPERVEQTPAAIEEAPVAPLPLTSQSADEESLEALVARVNALFSEPEAPLPTPTTVSKEETHFEPQSVTEVPHDELNEILVETFPKEIDLAEIENPKDSEIQPEIAYSAMDSPVEDVPAEDVPVENAEPVPFSLEDLKHLGVVQAPMGELPLELTATLESELSDDRSLQEDAPILNPLPMDVPVLQFEPIEPFTPTEVESVESVVLFHEPANTEADPPVEEPIIHTTTYGNHRFDMPEVPFAPFMETPFDNLTELTAEDHWVQEDDIAVVHEEEEDPATEMDAPPQSLPIDTDPVDEDMAKNLELFENRDKVIKEEAAVQKKKTQKSGLIAFLLLILVLGISYWAYDQFFSTSSLAPSFIGPEKDDILILANTTVLAEGQSIQNLEWTVQYKDSTPNVYDSNKISIPVASPGTYHITLRVQDQDGKWSKPHSQDFTFPQKESMAPTASTASSSETLDPVALTKDSNAFRTTEFTRSGTYAYEIPSSKEVVSVPLKGTLTRNDIVSLWVAADQPGEIVITFAGTAKDAQVFKQELSIQVEKPLTWTMEQFTLDQFESANQLSLTVLAPSTVYLDDVHIGHYK